MTTGQAKEVIPQLRLPLPSCVKLTAGVNYVNSHLVLSFTIKRQAPGRPRAISTNRGDEGHLRDEKGSVYVGWG